MKKLLHNIFAFVLVCVIATLFGCCPVAANKYEGTQVNKPVKVAEFISSNEEIRKLEFEGHEYIIYLFGVNGGHSASIVHSESCHNPVHEKKQEEKKDDYLGW